MVYKRYTYVEMDLIYGELRANGIAIDKDTLSSHINSVLEEHSYLYSHVGVHHSSLNTIYEEIEPINFGRVIAYLALVYRLSEVLGEQTIREAVRRTVKDLKRIDLSKYGTKDVKRITKYKTSLLGCWLRRLLLWTGFAYIELQKSLRD